MEWEWFAGGGRRRRRSLWKGVSYCRGEYVADVVDWAMGDGKTRSLALLLVGQ